MSHVSRPGADIFFEASDLDGPVLLLAHGFFMDSTMFERQATAAVAAGLRLVTWDARAHGQTRSKGPFDYWDSARDALAVLDELGAEQAFVGGMSQGGYCALRTALLAPERVRALVLLDTEASACTAGEAAGYREFFGAWANDNVPLEPLARGLAPQLIGGTEADQEPWIAKWLTTGRQHWNDAAEALTTRDSVTSRLGEISCPALVIRGESDETATAEKAAALAAGLPGAGTVRTIAGAGHAANWTDPESVNQELLSFLVQNL